MPEFRIQLLTDRHETIRTHGLNILLVIAKQFFSIRLIKISDNWNGSGEPFIEVSSCF